MIKSIISSNSFVEVFVVVPQKFVSSYDFFKYFWLWFFIMAITRKTYVSLFVNNSP